METYGYIRVSTRDQNPERQYHAMQEYGVNYRNIYLDMMSGKDFARPQYLRMLKKLRAGDLLIIKSIDRLGRNYDDILEQWRLLTKEKQVYIEVIDMPLLNTTTEREGLTGIFIADLVLQILAYVAETERAFIRQRQAEGIAVAKAKGVRFGHERAEIPDEFEECYKLWCEGSLSVRQAAIKAGMSYPTFYRRCKERQIKKQEIEPENE